MLVVELGIRAYQLLCGVIAGFEFVEYGIAQFLPIQRFRLDSFGKNVHAKAGESRVLQAFEVPVRRMGFDRNILL